MKSRQPSLLHQAARWYAQRGIPVFPCRPHGKEPLTKHGYKDASTDLAQIDRWWTQWPDANIGMPTGKGSGVIVLDIDPRHGGLDSYEVLVYRHGALPDTAEQITGRGDGGRHIFLVDPGIKLPEQLAEGIDIQASGSYVIMAPSIHPDSGKPYTWDGIAGKEALLKPAACPTWILEFAREPAKNGRETPHVLPHVFPYGHQHEYLTSLAGTMRNRGCEVPEIFAALLAINNSRLEKPAPEANLRKIAESVCKYAPGKVAQTGAGSLVIKRLSDIDAKPVNWLWPRRLARGKVNLAAGHPGLGKSQLTASVAAIVTTGGCFPVDRTQCAPGDVVFLSAEDDAADTLRPRLEAAGADLKRVHIVESVIAGYNGQGKQINRAFSLQEDIEALSQKLEELKDVAVVVIDPVSAYLGETDSHCNAEVRAILAPLSELAASREIAIIAISHLNKAPGMDAMLRVSGSLAFVAASRVAYLVAADPEDKARRLFLPLKNNLAPDDSGLAFRIEGAIIDSPAGPIETSRVMWESDPVAMTADEAMRPPAPEPELTPALSEAVEWLRATLHKPTPAADIWDLSRAKGIAERNLKRAAQMLDVLKAKNGMKGPWFWSLPPSPAKNNEEGQKKDKASEEGQLKSEEVEDGQFCKDRPSSGPAPHSPAQEPHQNTRPSSPPSVHLRHSKGVARRTPASVFGNSGHLRFSKGDSEQEPDEDIVEEEI